MQWIDTFVGPLVWTVQLFWKTMSAFSFESGEYNRISSSKTAAWKRKVSFRSVCRTLVSHSVLNPNIWDENVGMKEG